MSLVFVVPLAELDPEAGACGVAVRFWLGFSRLRVSGALRGVGVIVGARLVNLWGGTIWVWGDELYSKQAVFC